MEPLLRATRATLFAGLLLASSVAAAQSAEPVLRLVGLDGGTRTMTLADLRALAQVEVIDSSSSMDVARFRGPSIRALVSLVGAPEGRLLRGPSMTIVVVAEARDGYRVAYSLAELDEQFGARTAIVALTRNEQPLLEGDGPFRLIVRGEPHHARWLRQLTVIRIVDVGKLTFARPTPFEASPQFDSPRSPDGHGG